MNGHIMYDISSMGRAICSQRPWASAEGSSVVQLKVYDIEGPSLSTVLILPYAFPIQRRMYEGRFLGVKVNR